MAVKDCTTSNKVSDCPSLCKDCADKKGKRQGNKKLHYCGFTGLPISDSVKFCPYS